MPFVSEAEFNSQAFIVETKREFMGALLSSIYRTDDESQRAALNAEYDRQREFLKELPGPDAHCNEVDPGLFDILSDCWKDDNGCRPRHHVTWQFVTDWFKRREENPPAWMSEKGA
jgi:hypothetical protein